MLVRCCFHCLYNFRYDIASQKYQELIAYITEAPYSTKVHIYYTAFLHWNFGSTNLGILLCEADSLMDPEENSGIEIVGFC